MKIYKSFSILFTLISLLACEDQLNQVPISEASVSNFYRNFNEFEQGVNGTYAQLRPYPERIFNLSEIRSDNIYGVGQAGVRDFEPVNNFHTTLATNPLMELAWNENYNGIMRANTVLGQLIQNGNVIENIELRNRIEGEAKFLRAFYYFDLLRTFGGVPLFDETVTPEIALETGRSSVIEVYGLILEDLIFATENLPVSYGSANRGRATSWAAKGLLARVYLTRSGPNYGINGPGIDTSEYTEALNLLNDIIQNGPFSWVPSYPAIFDYDNQNNPDIIFDVQFQSGGQGLGSTYPGEMVPTEYFNAIGIPFPAGLEVKRISRELMDSFEQGDVRLNQSVQPGFIDVNGNFRPQPFYRKFLDENRFGVDRFDWGINFPIIRYTDVLLMKAECILQGAPGAQSEVDDIVNQVRQRAGIPPLSNVNLNTLLEERRKEFMAEGLRWHDLVRSGIVVETINAWINLEDASNQMNNINANHIIYAIPQNQLDVRQGLYNQNPGY